jgi:hypothetical protein
MSNDQKADQGTEILIDDSLDAEPQLPLEPPAPVAVASETKKTETAPKTDVESVETLKAQLSTARAQAAEATRLGQEREAAIAYARKMEAQAAAARGDAMVSNYDTIITGIRAAEADKDRVKARIREAFELGDGAAAAELQDELSQLNQRIAHMDEGRRQIEEDHERRRRQAEQTDRQTPVRQADPRAVLEQHIAPLSEPSKQWVRRHPDAFLDPSKKARVIQLDAVAQYQGLQPDTPAYFAFIEEQMGYRQPSDSRQTGRQSYAAPVSRTASGGSNPRQQTRVALSPAEQNMAKALDMTLEEYARGKIAMQKQRG